MKFFGPLINKYRAYKLQKAIAVLKDRTKFSEEVLAVCQALDATLVMTKGVPGNRPVHIAITRRELEFFVKYMTKMHDNKLSKIQELKYAVTAILMKRRLTDEDIEKLKKSEPSRIIVPAGGDGQRNSRRLRKKALAQETRR